MSKALVNHPIIHIVVEISINFDLFFFAEIFSKNIQDDVDKVLKKTMLNLTPLETAFEIDLAKKTPWIVFNELQFRLHLASWTPDRINYGDILQMTDDIQSCVNDHRLPDTMYKTTGIMTLHLLMLLGE